MFSRLAILDVQDRLGEIIIKLQQKVGQQLADLPFS